MNLKIQYKNQHNTIKILGNFFLCVKIEKLMYMLMQRPKNSQGNFEEQ